MTVARNDWVAGPGCLTAGESALGSRSPGAPGISTKRVARFAGRAGSQLEEAAKGLVRGPHDSGVRGCQDGDLAKGCDGSGMGAEARWWASGASCVPGRALVNRGGCTGSTRQASHPGKRDRPPVNSWARRWQRS